MPVLSLPHVPHYVPAKPTSFDLDYADLAIIDFAKASTLEGRRELAVQVRDAMSTAGFFYVINHGLTPAQTERMFDIADIPFTQVDPEEKKLYEGTMLQTGTYKGYKLRNYWHIDNGVRDQIEQYNINHDIYTREHPKALRPFMSELEQFVRHCHFNVLHPILRLLALGLELPEETFVEQHKFESVGETWLRFMKYYPRSEEDETKTKNVWLKGHTDFTTLSIIYSQPVSALQILTKDGKWKWVKHIENALVVNSGDAMEFLSGGFYRPTIHRVVQPPSDQHNHERLGVYYFCTADDDVKLLPRTESPVLQKVGVVRRFEDKDAPTMGEWSRARIAAYGNSKLAPAKELRVEEERVAGILVKHYN